MAVPRLGELVVSRGHATPELVERAVLEQRRGRARGDFLRLGSLLASLGRLPRPLLRDLLRQQGIEVLRCSFCARRYNGWHLQAPAQCLGCDNLLAVAPDTSPLEVEDTVYAPGPSSDVLRQAVFAQSPRVGPFVVVGEMGRGAMGVVFRAFDTTHRRFVALKFLQTHDYEEEARFAREAQALMRLKHPNIVRGHAVDQVPGLVYLAMDLAPGVPLDQLLARAALSPRELVEIVVQVADALVHMHEAGLIHRDVKPGNVVVDPEGCARLVDFGIVKAKDESMSLTEEGQVVGSLSTMAPEYLSGGVSALDARADVYALGVILYQGVSEGKHPFLDPLDPSFAATVVREPPVSLQRADPRVAPALAKLIDRAVAKDPQRRTPSAARLAAELRDFLESGRPCWGVPTAGLRETLGRFFRKARRKT